MGGRWGNGRWQGEILLLHSYYMPRDVGDWTRDKLKIIELYLPGYLGATTKASERVYVDAFAGPGQNRLRESQQLTDGSPLIALKARAGNNVTFSKLFFIEKDPSLADELREHVEKMGAANRAEVLCGDVNEILPRLMKRISKRSPTLVFLDTEGIEPKWNTVEAISQWQVEFLINFPLGMSINRNLESSKARDYFGTDEYAVANDQSDRERALLDLYKRRLFELGFQYTTEDDRLIRTQGNRKLYYLILASKNVAAKNIMDWVLKQPAASGQSRFDFSL